jgi:hypothetical protein
MDEKVEPQTQNTEDTNIGMIEGYAQDIIDLIEWYRESSEGAPDTVDDLVDEIKDKVAYLADHMAAL